MAAHGELGAMAARDFGGRGWLPGCDKRRSDRQRLDWGPNTTTHGALAQGQILAWAGSSSSGRQWRGCRPAGTRRPV